MDSHEERENDLLQKSTYIGGIILLLVITFAIAFHSKRFSKNLTNYKKYGSVNGVVWGKRITRNPKARYEISVGMSFTNVQSPRDARFTFAFNNDSFFKLVRTGNSFIKNSNENTFIVVHASDTFFYDTTNDFIYRRERIYR